MNDFIELHGDRKFSDDSSIVGGFARFKDIPVIVVGHQKGRTTKERIYRNFGQAHPEGYRKALRIMKLGERFRMPIITFIDTPGACPGIGAEERGQSEAIANNLLEMFYLKTPIIPVIIGEGGSGGALSLAIGDRVLMLEHSVYSVISPEGCAAILWKKEGSEIGQKEFEKAADALKITAQDLYDLAIIDEIVAEPVGGAHRDHNQCAKTLESAIERHLMELNEKPMEALIEDRYRKFREIGAFNEQAVNIQK